MCSWIRDSKDLVGHLGQAGEQALVLLDLPPDTGDEAIDFLDDALEHRTGDVRKMMNQFTEGGLVGLSIGRRQGGNEALTTALEDLAGLHLRLHGLVYLEQAFGATVDDALLLRVEQTHQASVFLELVPKQSEQILPIEGGANIRNLGDLNHDYFAGSALKDGF